MFTRILLLKIVHKSFPTAWELNISDKNLFECFEGYSWCVNKKGREIEGTATAPGQPLPDCKIDNFNENNREPKKLLDGIVGRYKRFMNENVKKASTRRTVTKRLERISKNLF